MAVELLRSLVLDVGAGARWHRERPRDRIAWSAERKTGTPALRIVWTRSSYRVPLSITAIRGLSDWANKAGMRSATEPA